jgi:hypothetical protein
MLHPCRSSCFLACNNIAVCAAVPAAPAAIAVAPAAAPAAADKNPVLKEFATEVTKIINEAVSKLEAQR